MPEGHTIHRLARDIGEDLIGHPVAAETRQERFVENAARLDGRVLERTTALGKHLFLHFAESDARGPEVLYVHLGLVGKFRRHAQPAPEPSEALRVRLAGPTAAWDLTGPMTAELRGPEVLDEVAAALGPDPLDRHADADAFLAAVRGSNRAIGDLLLDQAVIAGLGNVYRAEILHLAGIHPATEGRAMTDDDVRSLWDLSVEQLQLGFERNRIFTVPLAGRTLADVPKAESFHVYQQDQCRSCGAPVTVDKVGGRTMFACLACQPAS